MKKRKIATLAFILLAIALLSINVQAIGITPGKRIIEFEPNAKKTVDLTIINNQQKDFRAYIYTEGDFGIELLTDEIIFTKNDDRKPFSFTVDLPESLEPGTHEIKIFVSELLPKKAGDISVGVQAEVVFKLYIEVPFPGKYIRAELYAVEKDDGIDFVLPVYNLGKENIESVTGLVTVYDLYNNKITEEKTNQKSIKKSEAKELIAHWDHDDLVGEYKATATIFYDEKTLNLDTSFTLGTFFIKLLNIFVENFQLGGIAKFNILVKNLGNVLVKGFYSNIVLSDNDGENVADIESQRIDIGSQAEGKLFAFWDTKDVEKGTYSGKVVLSYGNRSIETRITSKVTEDSIKTEIFGITAFAVAEEDKETNNLVSILGVLVILLMVANIGWFVYTRKKRV